MNHPIAPCVLGIDPGLSGAVAYYFPDHPGGITAEDIPLAAGEVDAVTLARRIQQMRPTMAVIELVGSRPGQGVSSTFKFGVAFGVLRGVALTLGVPLHRVAPTTWKRHFKLGPDKEQARAMAISLWPASDAFSRKRDHNRAEAALLARYGAEALFDRSLAGKARVCGNRSPITGECILGCGGFGTCAQGEDREMAA